MVPVLSDTGSLIACMVYADPIGILSTLYGCMTMPRQYSDSIQTIVRQANNHVTSIPCGTLYNNNAFGCTGQPIIQSSLKTKTMAKSTSTSGVSADSSCSCSYQFMNQIKLAYFRPQIQPFYYEILFCNPFHDLICKPFLRPNETRRNVKKILRHLQAR
jgi:hypothetical protein